MLTHEHQAKRDGYEFIIGVDEAGRGPLAGPVVAAAVLLHNTSFQNKIRDSKKLSSVQREKAFHEIQDKADIGIGIMSESVIDRHNILQATHEAMVMAVDQLFYKINRIKRLPEDVYRKSCALIDGNSSPADMPIACRTIIKGDNASLSIACASIIAKVTRDRILDTYDKIFPQYGFSRHKGYPTAEHKEALRQHGFSLIHRRTFQF